MVLEKQEEGERVCWSVYLFSLLFVYLFLYIEPNFLLDVLLDVGDTVVNTRAPESSSMCYNC